MEQAALLEKRDRTVPGYSTFSPMDTWRRCIIYHLIYHHTLSLHLNHLLLLHTYVLGIFVVAISIHLYFLFSVVSLFCIFEVTFARCTIHGWSHALLVVVPLGLLAWTAATQLVPLQSLGTKIFCGFFLSLISLLLQVAGHHAWEEFEAPPQTLHGLLAAPVLEWTSMWLRLYPDEGVWDEVRRAREEARRR